MTTPYQPGHSQQPPQRLPYIASSNAGLTQLWLVFWVLVVLAVISLFASPGSPSASIFGILAVFTLVVALAVNSIAREMRGYRS